jgi:hypothetical protein
MELGFNRAEPLVPQSSASGRLHPWREILRRARDPRLVADTALRTLTTAWDRVSPSEFSSFYRLIRNHTMCSNARLRGLYHGLHDVVIRNVPGDVVECGSARGGSAALMGLTLRKLGAQRKMWLFDTFEGLPAPSVNDPDRDIADLFTGTCVGTVEEVRGLFACLNLLQGTEFVQGLFQDTVAVSPISQIAFLHIDGDWYESVKTCLENLYEKVAPGGIIQLDDYGYWQGARKAVDEFLGRRGIQSPLQRLDYSGRFFVKPDPAAR